MPRSPQHRRWLLPAALAGAAAAAPVHAQRPPAFDAAAWQADVRTIAREIPARHPNAFYRLDRTTWDSAVAATERRMPGLTRNQAVVALMELVALVHDGHTSINPLFDLLTAARTYPIRLYAFEDGLFVRAAAPEYRELVGGRVVRIGRVDADGFLAAAGRVVPHENDGWVRTWGPDWLNFAEILDGLGLVEDPERLPIVVEMDGARRTVVVRPVPRRPPTGHRPGAAFDRGGWVDMRGTADAPLWQRRPDEPYWAEFVPGDSTLYVAYRGVVSLPAPNTNTAFWRRVFAMADSLPVARMVLDIRENSGGESFYNRQVVRGIVARPRLDQPDRLFVITGRPTFSAAMNLARDLAQWTGATFVGEPTGNAMVFFGDHARLTLAASGLTLAVSTLPWPPYDPRDRRDFLAPALFAPLTSADYAAGTDPAFRAIMAAVRTPPLAARIESAALAGSTAEVERLLREERERVARRYRSPESEANAVGYRLLSAGQVAAAIVVLDANARVFERSANAWDSLGEALVAAGRQADAVAAYRHALAIDPGFGPSRQALERLGVHLAP